MASKREDKAAVRFSAQQFFQFLGYHEEDKKRPASKRSKQETRSKGTSPPKWDTDSDSEESIKNPFTDSESSDWVPSDDHDDDDDSDSDINQTQNLVSSDYHDVDNDDSGRNQTQGVQIAATESSAGIINPETVDDSHSENSVDSVVYPALNLPSVKPQMQSDTTSCKKWSKKHHCIFCETYVIKIARHMERKHKNEIQVAQILTLPVGSKNRRQAWVQLLKEGDYVHNYNTLKTGNGLLIPQYGKTTSNADLLIPCPNCKALYKKKYLSKHCASCAGSPKEANKRGQMSKKGKLLLPVPAHVSKSFWNKVVLSMNVDKISKICKNDSLILKYGERIFSKRDVEEHTPNNVSSRVRELGRLVDIVRKKSLGKIQSLSDVLCVTNFDLLLSCVKELAIYSDDLHQFNKGSLALRLGYSLKKCSMIKKMEAKKNQSEEEEKHAHNFLELIQSDWSDYISSTANQSLGRKSFNKPLLLPSCSDVHTLYNYVKNNQASDYPTLAQTALCEISLFNRKRGGEVQRMTVDDYMNGLKSDEPHDDILKSLDETEKLLVKQLSRIEIRGKFNRKVPIMPTNSMKQKLSKILELRYEFNITSKYMFIRLNGEKPYRGSDIIQAMASAAGVENTHLFTWTCLRKHVATLCQAMEVTENDQDLLADFLGHDIRVHRKYYRLPNNIMEKARVAKILMQVNSGNFSSFKDVKVAKDEEMPMEDGVKNESNDESDMEDGDNSTTPEAQSQSTHDGDNAESYETVNKISNVAPCHDRGRRKKPASRRPWSHVEEDAVMKHLNHCVMICKVPNKDIILKVLEKEPALQDRTWKNVKDYVYNKIQKRRRRCN